MGSSIGQIFKVTTFGESHGAESGVLMVPTGIPIDLSTIQRDLDEDVRVSPLLRRTEWKMIR